MSHHQRSLTQQSLNITFTDLPVTYEAYSEFASNKSLESFSKVAQICLTELQEKSLTTLTLPKDLQGPLLYYLSKIDLSLPLNCYFPCLALLQHQLSNSHFQVSMALVTSLCQFLSDIKNFDPSQAVIQITFALIEVLFHLALSRRKRSDNNDSAWIQKIFLTFCGVLTELVTKPELDEIAKAEYEMVHERISIESRVISKGQSTDLVLYLVVAVSKLAKILTNTVPNEVFAVTIPSLLQHTIKEFRQKVKYDINNMHIKICMEKTIAIFQFFNILCALTVKLDYGRELIKAHCDKMQTIFYLTVLEFFNLNLQVTSVRFNEDESILGRLFQQLFEIMAGYLLHSELEAFPLQIFAIFIQHVLFI